MSAPAQRDLNAIREAVWRSLQKGKDSAPGSSVSSRANSVPPEVDAPHDEVTPSADSELVKAADDALTDLRLMGFTFSEIVEYGKVHPQHLSQLYKRRPKAEITSAGVKRILQRPVIRPGNTGWPLSVSEAAQTGSPGSQASRKLVSYEGVTSAGAPAASVVTGSGTPSSSSASPAVTAGATPALPSAPSNAVSRTGMKAGSSAQSSAQPQISNTELAKSTGRGEASQHSLGWFVDTVGNSGRAKTASVRPIKFGSNRFLHNLRFDISDDESSESGDEKVSADIERQQVSVPTNTDRTPDPNSVSEVRVQAPVQPCIQECGHAKASLQAPVQAPVQDPVQDPVRESVRESVQAPDKQVQVPVPTSQHTTQSSAKTSPKAPERTSAQSSVHGQASVKSPVQVPIPSAAQASEPAAAQAPEASVRMSVQTPGRIPEQSPVQASVQRMNDMAASPRATGTSNTASINFRNEWGHTTTLASVGNISTAERPSVYAVRRTNAERYADARSLGTSVVYQTQADSQGKRWIAVRRTSEPARPPVYQIGDQSTLPGAVPVASQRAFIATNQQPAGRPGYDSYQATGYAGYTTGNQYTSTPADRRAKSCPNIAYGTSAQPAAQPSSSAGGTTSNAAVGTSRLSSLDSQMGTSLPSMTSITQQRPAGGRRKGLTTLETGITNSLGRQKSLAVMQLGQAQQLRSELASGEQAGSVSPGDLMYLSAFEEMLARHTREYEELCDRIVWMRPPASPLLPANAGQASREPRPSSDRAMPAASPSATTAEPTVIPQTGSASSLEASSELSYSLGALQQLSNKRQKANGTVQASMKEVMGALESGTKNIASLMERGLAIMSLLRERSQQVQKELACAQDEDHNLRQELDRLSSLASAAASSNTRPTSATTPPSTSAQASATASTVAPTATFTTTDAAAPASDIPSAATSAPAIAKAANLAATRTDKTANASTRTTNEVSHAASKPPSVSAAVAHPSSPPRTKTVKQVKVKLATPASSHHRDTQHIRHRSSASDARRVQSHGSAANDSETRGSDAYETHWRHASETRQPSGSISDADIIVISDSEDARQSPAKRPHDSIASHDDPDDNDDDDDGLFVPSQKRAATDHNSLVHDTATH